jgi:IS6 family transposase
MQCVRCGSGRTRRDGQTRLGGQRRRCAVCRRRFTARSASAFSGRRFPDDGIALAVRWYARFRLSDADVTECLAERGFAVGRSAVSRWVQRFLPLFGAAARGHRRRVGEQWHVDETYCAFRGRHAYIYRAIDQDGQVVDARFRERRNAAAARVFFERALAATEVMPERVTSDKAKGYPPALRAVLPWAEHRRSKYLNNGLERDHSHLQQRLDPMRGCKRGTPADTFARGHALARNLRGGFSGLTEGVAPNLRLATAWPLLARAISRSWRPFCVALRPRRRRVC